MDRPQLSDSILHPGRTDQDFYHDGQAPGSLQIFCSQPALAVLQEYEYTLALLVARLPQSFQGSQPAEKTPETPTGPTVVMSDSPQKPSVRIEEAEGLPDD